MIPATASAVRLGAPIPPSATAQPTSGSRRPRWFTAERAGREDGVDELAAAMEEARRVATGRAVVEVELDLLELEPGAKRVDRHPYLAAEAGRERKARRRARARET